MFTRAWPSRGSIVFIDIRRVECIVRAFMLNAAMPVGASRRRGDELFVDDEEKESCKHPIK